jgi:hypothetical protein
MIKNIEVQTLHGAFSSWIGAGAPPYYSYMVFVSITPNDELFFLLLQWWMASLTFLVAGGLSESYGR